MATEMTQSVLLTEKPSKLFYQYLMATVFANLTHALYVLVDVLCIGVGVGSDALAAMNIALPIFTVYTAIALCIGIGGGTTMSFLMGIGKIKESQQIFTLASVLVGISGIILTLLGTVFIEPLAMAFGASEALMPLVKAYLMPVNMTCAFFMYSHMLQVFLRNDHSPRLAMIASVTGSVLNIVFDIIFIFVLDMGIVGAALPTALSPIVVILIMMLHFKKPTNNLAFKKKFFSFKITKMIIQNGFGVFLLELMAGLSIFVFNSVLIRNYGVLSVSAYAVMANIVYVAKSIYNGIAQAAQPIISINQAHSYKERAVEVTLIATLTALAAGVVSYLIIICFPEAIMGAFTNDQALIAFGAPHLKTYFVCLVFAGMNTVWMYYFQSTARPLLSIVTSTCKGLIFIFIGLVILEPLLGLAGVYLVTGFAEGVTCIITGIIFWSIIKKQSLVS